MKIKCSIDNRYKQYNTKPKGAEYAIIQNNINEIEISIDNLVSNILRGISFKCAVVNGLKDSDFVQQQLFCIDIDNDNSDYPIQNISDIELISKFNNLPIAFAYYTFSHTQTKHKFRVAFLSNKVVISKEEVELINKYFISLFNQSDTVTYNASRLYLGTNNGIAIDINYNMFDYDTVLELAYRLETRLKESKLNAKLENQIIYDNSDNSDFEELKDKIKDYSLNYMSQYSTKLGYNCCNCKSGTGKKRTGITFIKNNNNKVLKCFSCDWKGDIIHYHKTINKLEYITAVKELASMFNIDFKLINKNNNYNNIDDDVISDYRYNRASINNIDNTIEVVVDKKELELEAECKKLDKKTKEARFNEIISKVDFIPNMSVEFIRDTILKIPTGGGKTYNLIQICLNKIINRDSKNIIIMTSSNDLVNDFTAKLVLAIREIIANDSPYFNYDDLDNILKYANILKLNVDTEKVEDFSIYDIVITNQAYLYSKGDTLKNSKKFNKLVDIINNNRDLYDLYIDEIHVLENYKYSTITLSQLVKSNENNTLNRTYQKINNYFIHIQNNHYDLAEISYKLALLECDLNIYRYKFNDNGLVNTKILLDNISIQNSITLNKTCLKIIDNRYSLVAVTKIVNFEINKNLNNISNQKSQQEFNNFVSSSVDKFIIENSIEIVDKTTKKTIEFDNHLCFYNYAIDNFDYSTIVVDMMKIINNNLVNNNKHLFSKILFIEKPQIQLNCDKFYCTATTDNITHKYNVVNQDIVNQVCKINKINVLFCSMDLLGRLKNKSSLSIINLDKKLNKATNIILSEKYKILELEKKLKQMQAENLANTVIHFEKNTKTITDDTKVNPTISLVKVSYMQETRQTGTDFSDTEILILDSKRTVNSNEKYNRYINKDGELTTIYNSDTQIVFNHAKQVIGRILRGEIEEKTIVICLPDKISINDVDNLDNVFNTAKYIELFKTYFENEFTNIDMNYTDYTNIKNKTQLVKKVAEYLNVFEAVKTEKQELKENRDNLIKARYKELKPVLQNEKNIINTILSEFDIKERQLYNILDIKKDKASEEEYIIDYINECKKNKLIKSDIIKLLINVKKISKSKAYRLLDKYY